jgi:hypothetical protein
MGWLRRDKDCIALVVVWALLVQAAILSYASGAHAAALARGQDIVLCTAKGAVIGRELPGQSHRKADCQCCAMSCRSACGASAALASFELRVLPLSPSAPAEPLRRLHLRAETPEASPAQPRAPPRA